MENKTISEKIKIYSDSFKTIKRSSTGEDIVILKDDAPEELKKAIEEAHGERLPDDWIFGTFADLLSNLTGYTVNNIDDVEEYRAEIVDGYVDIDNKELTDWLNNSIYNVESCNEAAEEYGSDKNIDIIDRIKQGQYWAIDQVYAAILSLLAK